jgi:hypothetical protein
MNQQTSTEAHRWLQQLVGDWSYESDVLIGHATPRETFTGTESVRPLGEFWIVAEGESGMPGGPSSNSMMTLGYDPDKGRFTGTFVHSEGSYLWLYDGELDRDGKALTLSSEGPSMAGEGITTRYRDVIELTDNDHRTFISEAIGEDGRWHGFMTARYQRV